MQRIALTLLAFVALPVWAGSATLSSIAPTQNVDDSTITDVPLQVCYWVSDAQGSYDPPLDKQCVANVDPDAESTYVFDNLPAGEYFFVATAIDSTGDESAFSNEVTKIVTDTVPIPPGGTAVAGETAYIIVQSNESLVLLPIGTVSTDTACTPNTAVADDNGVTAYKVPTTAITPFNAGQELIVAFAPCGG